MSRLPLFRALIVALALVTSCAPSEPAPIAYGEADCDFCSMRITDRRYGAELVTSTGKVHQFDAIECLASYYVKSRAGAPVRSMYVTDYRKPGTLIRADQALFVRGGPRHSPMGLDFTAFGADADSMIRRETGRPPLRWADVVAAVQQAGLTAAAPSGTATARHAVAAEADTVAAPLDTHQIVVSPTGVVRTLGAALARADSGTRIVVTAGTYREPTIRVEKPVTIAGEGAPVLDGEGQRPIMVVVANGVTVRGLTFRNVGTSYIEDRAALRIAGVTDCVIEDNRIEQAFFGIYLAGVSHCRIARNVIHGVQSTEGASGNGIHLWSSHDITIVDNEVSGERDGIYFEFVRHGDVRGNRSEHNLRYGLHFMFSDSCHYQDNTFRSNGAGVAVMFTKHVDMIANRFEENWGSAAYGLLLKEIYDSRLERNVFSHNTTGLVADGANRIDAVHNEFVNNGWAVKLFASTQDGTFTANNFAGNTFDVTTNSVESNTNRFTGNYWSDYEGYDLNHDGAGDVPFHPVRLFSALVERNPPAIILLRSLFVGLLDTAERVLPSLTPETMVDERPAMRPVK